MNHARRLVALLALVVASTVWLLACGGQAPSADHGTGPADGSGGDGGRCLPEPCPSNLGWDEATCSCDVSLGSDDAGPPVYDLDATMDCSTTLCPIGTVPQVLYSRCVCAQPELSPPGDSSPDVDASDLDVTDSPYPDDVYYYYPDVYYYYDTGPGPDSPYCYYPPYCGNGYMADSNCQCVPCAQSCPPGQTQSYACGGCVACSYACPVGLVAGPNCGCVPPGTEAGPPPPVDGGDGGAPSCLLEGTYSCAAGSWCELGTCPDGMTQYGCYCDATGKATCDLSCPKPPACSIPGQAACPYGSQCAYGSCADPASSLLICSCYSGGSAYCSTASCADGGPTYLDAGPPSDGGVTCLLEGYTTCSAGQFCSLGTCPGGTQYGCFCNQDGTATCNLTCPPAPPCQIPGEGECAYGTQCTFGSCSGSSGALLSCYCGYGGASCNTQPCSAFGGEQASD